MLQKIMECIGYCAQAASVAALYVAAGLGTGDAVEPAKPLKDMHSHELTALDKIAREGADMVYESPVPAEGLHSQELAAFERIIEHGAELEF